MAEIKSTLDLVLEKTRNLKMTEEEKVKAKEDEVRGKMKGLIQKYVDGSLSLDAVLQAIESQGTDMARRFVESEALERMEPSDDDSDGNNRLLGLLDKLAPSKGVSLRNILETWSSTIPEEREKYSADAKKRWAASRLTGSALVPNLDKDPAWKTHLERKRASFREAVRHL